MKSKTKKCNTKKHGGMRSTRMKKPPKRLTYQKKSPPKKSKRQTKRQTKKTKTQKKTQNKTQTKKLNKLLLNNIKETSKEEIHKKCMECGKGFYTSAECPQKLCGYHRRSKHLGSTPYSHKMAYEKVLKQNKPTLNTQDMDSIANWSQYNWVHSNPNKKKEEQKAAHMRNIKRYREKASKDAQEIKRAYLDYLNKSKKKLEYDPANPGY